MNVMKMMKKRREKMGKSKKNLDDVGSLLDI